MNLSIVIPAYNEERRISTTLEDYGRFYAERAGYETEIIVVANHCSDRTADVVAAAAERYPKITLMVEPRRVGKGGAVELGMRAARGDLIGFVDADGSTSPESFFHLVENLGDAGCAIGSRWIEGAVVSPRQSWPRRLASRVLNKMIVKGMFGLDVRDSQCGAKVFRTEVLREILPNAVEPGWAFDIELLCRIKRLGHAIKELPIEWHHCAGNPTAFVVMSMQMLASVWRVKKALARP